jgi:hypothetical protein
VCAARSEPLQELRVPPFADLPGADTQAACSQAKLRPAPPTLSAYEQVSFLSDAESSLGDAKSSLGDAESSLGDA